MLFKGPVECPPEVFKELKYDTRMHKYILIIV